MRGPMDVVHTHMEPGVFSEPRLRAMQDPSPLSLVFQESMHDVAIPWPLHNGSRSPTGSYASTVDDHVMEKAKPPPNSAPVTPRYEDYASFGEPVPDDEAMEYSAGDSPWWSSRYADWTQQTPEYE